MWVYSALAYQSTYETATVTVDHCNWTYRKGPFSSILYNDLFNHSSIPHSTFVKDLSIIFGSKLIFFCVQNISDWKYWIFIYYLLQFYFYIYTQVYFPFVPSKLEHALTVGQLFLLNAFFMLDEVFILHRIWDGAQDYNHATLLVMFNICRLNWPLA